jgi:hypothetical protein
MAKTLELDVVGMNYRITPATMRKLAQLLPRECQLERDPENIHDPNAIKVILIEDNDTGWHIGFVRRQTAEAIAPKLDAGAFPFHLGVLVQVDIEKGIGQLVMERSKAL